MSQPMKAKSALWVGGAWHSFAVQLVDKATYIEKARKTVRASRLGGNLELGILEDEEFVDEEFVDFFFGFDSVTGDEELVEEEKEKRHSLREREKRQSLGSQEDEERPISSASTGLPSSRDTPDTQRNF